MNTFFLDVLNVIIVILWYGYISGVFSKMLNLIRYIPAVFSPILFVDGLDNRRISFCTDNSKTMFPENYVVYNLFI